MSLFDMKIKNIIYFIIAFVAFFCFFFHQTMSKQTDLWLHIKISRGLHENLTCSPILFYYVVGLFESEFLNMIVVGLLMSFAVLFKFHLTIRLLKDSLVSEKSAYLGAILLLFMFGLPSLFLLHKAMYMGNYVPNVWHNTTTIFLMPFAILLFIELFVKEQKKYFYIVLLIIVNAIIKPSFLFVLLPTLGVFVIYEFYQNRTLTSNQNSKYYVVAIVAISILILIQKTLIFDSNTSTNTIALGFIHSSNSQLPLYYLPFALVASFGVPLWYVVTKHWYKNKTIMASLLALIFALIISFVVSEEGSRAKHGNFSWQIIPSYYLFLLFTLKVHIDENAGTLNFKHPLTLFYFVSFVYGILYLIKLITFNYHIF